MHGLRTHWRFLLVAAWVLSFLGIELRDLAVHGSDIPQPTEWATEVAALYRPWVHRAPGWPGAIAPVAAAADPGARTWKLLCLRWNGQWDPRLLALTALVPGTLAGGLFFAAVLGELSVLAGLLLAAASVGALIFPAVLAQTLDPAQTWGGLLLFFSVAHLAGTARCRPTSTGWWAAQLAGLGNVLLSTAGLASPLAILAGVALQRRIGAAKPARGLTAWNISLVALGLARALATGSLARGSAPATAPFLGAWPLAFPGGALVVAAPALALIGATYRQATSAFSVIRLLTLWILLQTALLAAGGMLPPGGAGAVLGFGLLVQLAALAAIPASGGGRLGKILLGAAWLILIGNGLFQHSQGRPGIDEEIAAVRARGAAVRQFLADGRPEDLAPAIAGGGISAADAADLLTDARVQALLPAALRPALDLAPDGPGAFAAAAAPEIGGKPALLATWGNWRPTGPFPAGAFTSRELHSSAPLLQIYAAGQLAPPASDLLLRARDGREISALEARVDAASRWKQLNFAAPAGAFRVVARSAGGRNWLAFSAPLEAGRFSWLARKVAAAWPILLCLGLVLASGAGAGAVLAWQAEAPADRFAPPLTRGLADYAPWLALFAYALLLANFLDPYAAGADASGYLNSAKLLVHGHLTFPPRLIPGVPLSPTLLAPLGFGASHGRIVPGYPVGLPLLLAAFGRVLSLDRAIPVVVIANLLLGVFFTRRLAEICGLSRGWAWIAAAAVALCPLYVFMGLQPMSDGPSLVWVTAALYFALASRTRPRLALAAGGAAALAVLLRPANVICLLPVALALGLSGRRLAWCAAGGLPGALFAAWYNRHLYGSPLATGYGDVSSSFTAGWVPITLRHYARWLTALLTPLVWLALLGPAMSVLTRPARRALTAAVLGYLGFYALYCFTHETWWYLRFVLPCFPCLTVLALAALQWLLRRAGLGPERPGGRHIVAGAALVGLLVGNVVWQYARLPVLYSGRGNEVYRRSARWVDEHVPAGAVLLAYQTSGALAFYTRHALVRSEVINTSDVASAVRRLGQLHRPVYAVVFRFDSMPELGQLPGRWRQVAQLDEVAVWQWAAASP